MKPEKLLENKFIKLCKRYSMPARKTKVISDPGFPDTLIINNLLFMFVEIKIADSENVKFISIFEKTQPPWYIKYFNEGGRYSTLCVLIEIKKDYYFFPITKEMILDRSLSIQKAFKIRSYYLHRKSSSLESIVQSIKGGL